MKISYNWLSTYLPLEGLSPEKISIMLTRCGLEVEGMEKFQSVKGGLEGLVVGKVLSCDRHPNADKLSLTTVDVGSGTPLQIVCGAPNVAAGQTVVVAPVGTTVHPAAGEPFEIRKSKIRGELSEGMICAEDEIGLGASHAGILLLPDHLAPGTLVRDHFKVEDDTVFEIGLTP
ncbi:MAG: YtpR family tRNA-binding protein, partial [Bacteroidota bacterium]